MRENYQPKVSKTTISSWITESSKILLSHGIKSARLDTEIILSSTLHRDRTYLVAHGELYLSKYLLKRLNKKIERRLNREPIAYIVGQKNFFGRNFIVSRSTLIPRPESEDIFEAINNIKLGYIKNVIDVGSGSGCLGITAKLEHPFFDITLIDISKRALKIAKINALRLDAKIHILHSNLLKSYFKTADLIIANLPYVDITWERSPETNYEPKQAIIARNGGLQLIKKLIIQASGKLTHNGYLILEADPCQFERIVLLCRKFNLSEIYRKNYIIVFQKLV
jgi:release factor glutamine methyltransferase